MTCYAFPISTPNCRNASNGDKEATVQEYKRYYCENMILSNTCFGRFFSLIQNYNFLLSIYYFPYLLFNKLTTGNVQKTTMWLTN